MFQTFAVYICNERKTQKELEQYFVFSNWLVISSNSYFPNFVFIKTNISITKNSITLDLLRAYYM